MRRWLPRSKWTESDNSMRGMTESPSDAASADTTPDPPQISQKSNEKSSLASRFWMFKESSMVNSSFVKMSSPVPSLPTQGYHKSPLECAGNQARGSYGPRRFWQSDEKNPTALCAGQNNALSMRSFFHTLSHSQTRTHYTPQTNATFGLSDNWAKKTGKHLKHPCEDEHRAPKQ